MEQLDQIRAATLDPEIHRIARNELRLLDLLEYIELESRIDVTEKHERSVPELLRDFRAEARKHAEVCLECLRGVEIVTIASTPSERLAVSVLESGEVYAARGKWLEFFDWVVGADDADHLNGREQARRRGKECSRAAEHIIGFAERSFYGIERDRSDNE